ncbi:phosphate ABC transporter substrate-binding protein PstS [Phenylobacterium sp. LjRoot219]|uniref:phosphate ABC transporter substrate-binding protein PstS n=1 Tax=Phenylobacterium sp. LjRoot219 TaxID=3342283 RepID=UPI003ECC2394
MKSAVTTTLALAASALLLFGCGKSQDQAQKAGAPPAGGTVISGAGATFPAPIYARWAEAYKAESGQVLNYQAIGSGGGVKQINARTVDFGATDKPLKPEDLDKAGLHQFPTVIGGVVPVVNLPGVQPGQLKLTGALLADIYLGTVKKWNDPQIVQANAGLQLPNLPITVVHRSDGSGTSFLYTTYLAGQSPAWAQKVGASDAVEWPTGIGGKGNDGVAAFVRQTAGAIGYVEYAYASQNGLGYAGLKNRDGAFVNPTAESFAAAAAGADWAKAPGNYLVLIDQPGAGAWPITGATFILLHKQQADAAKGRAVLSFFDWAYKNGDEAAAKLHYVPLPAAVKDMMRKQWSEQIKGTDGKPVFPGA